MGRPSFNHEDRARRLLAVVVIDEFNLCVLRQEVGMVAGDACTYIVNEGV